MEIMSFPWVSLSIFSIVVLIIRSAWRVLRWAWVRPKALERALRDQGLTGNSYSLLFGDLKEISKMSNQARSKPINFTNDIAPRVFPFFHQNVKNYGMSLILLPKLPFTSYHSIWYWEDAGGICVRSIEQSLGLVW
ncbi:hypothetical protein SLA2020_485770 [Shorea laevis]